jgi:hypothetical protein
MYIQYLYTDNKEIIIKLILVWIFIFGSAYASNGSLAGKGGKAETNSKQEAGRASKKIYVKTNEIKKNIHNDVKKDSKKIDEKEKKEKDEKNRKKYSVKIKFL